MTEAILQVKDLSVYYNKKKALNSVSLDFQPKEITALIGPSDQGKSTFPQGHQPHGDPKSRSNTNWFSGLQRSQYLQPTYRYG